MSSDGINKIYSDQDYQSQVKPKNVPASTGSGELVEHDQFNTALSNKQDNVIGGSGIKITGSTVSVDLSSSEVDNSVLTITGSNSATLDGNYTRANYEAYLVYKSGTDGDFDLKYGGDFAFFYKDNGNGTWSIVGANDSDGNANSNNQWYAVTTVNNPATVTGDVINYVVDSNTGVGGIQDQITNSHDLDENGKRVPTDTDSQVAYGAGASNSYLAFDGGKLKVEVVNNTNDAATTNLLDAQATVTAIDEAEARAKVASNTSFSNASANIAGNPTNVQAMGEALEEEIDTIDSTVQGLSTVQGVLSSRQSTLADVSGVALGQTSITQWASGPDYDELTLSGMSDTDYNGLYESVGYGYVSGGTYQLDTSDQAIYKQAVGNGNFRVIYSNDSSGFFVNEFDSDPSTWTSGNAVTSVSTSESVSGYATPINGIYLPDSADANVTFGTLTTSAFLFGASTLVEGVQAASEGAVTSLTVLGTVLGLNQGETDFGAGFTILPNNADQKTLNLAIEAELQTLATGAGSTWKAGVVQSVHESNIADLSSPGTDTFGGVTLAQGDVFLAAGQTAQSQNGFYVFDTSSTALVRWAEADATGDFIQNRSVQIVSDGTEWAYKGVADPTVGADVLPFEKIRDSITPDLSISRNKLASEVTVELDGKTDKVGADVILVGDTALAINHSLNSTDVIIQVRDASGEVASSVEKTVVNSSTIELRSAVGFTGRVVVIG